MMTYATCPYEFQSFSPTLSRGKGGSQAATVGAQKSSYPEKVTMMMAHAGSSAVRASAFFRRSSCRLPRPAQSWASVSTRSATLSSYGTVVEGDSNTEGFRMFVTSEGKKISPWHDIPLFTSDKTCNFFCEIPKETSAKMECDTEGALNPIKQDMKKGNLRFYPYNINWNYGMLPQTWEDPEVTNKECNAAGDNDPVDVVEIGGRQMGMGEVAEVKPLGCLAMIDEGELDWKVLAIATSDPHASEIHDVDDIEKFYPGTVDAVRTWFRDYKIPDGKPANSYGYDDKALGRDFAIEVIKETQGLYNGLKSRADKGDLVF